MRGDLNAASCWDSMGTQAAVLPEPRVPGGVGGASQTSGKNQLHTLPPLCLLQPAAASEPPWATTLITTRQLRWPQPWLPRVFQHRDSPPQGPCTRPCPGAGGTPPVPTPGGQASRLGHSPCWDRAGAGGPGATTGSRRQQTPTSAPATALSAGLAALEKCQVSFFVFFQKRKHEGAESLGGPHRPCHSPHGTCPPYRPGCC